MPPTGSQISRERIFRSCFDGLRNADAVSMEDDVEDALRDLAGEFGMTHNDTIRFIVREWMEKNTCLP